MPTGDDDDGDGELMRSIRAVIQYTNMDMQSVLELPCDVFMLCHKNWTIDRLNETDEGREYLATCERLRITKMDMSAFNRLKTKFG